MEKIKDFRYADLRSWSKPLGQKFCMNGKTSLPEMYM